MTTAHRPTFDPARGKDAQRGPAYHQRLLPAHKTLKFRQATQGTAAEASQRDLRAELLRAEKRHFAKKEGRELTPSDDEGEGVATDRDARLAIDEGKPDHEESARGVKRNLEGEVLGGDGHAGDGDEAEEDYETKRRRVLEETREIDAESSGSSSEEEDSDEDDESEDETAELMRELAKIKKERAEAAAKEAAEKAAKEEEEREFNIARGNPLLNSQDYGVKRRWDDDVVFKNQGRGTSEKEKGRGKEFVNDLLRSDFHKRFMNKYVR